MERSAEKREEKSTNGRTRSVPPPLAWTVAALQRLSPPLAAWAVEPLFLSPSRYARPAAEQDAYARARRSTVLHRGKRIPVYRWGAGPTVLFAHGWEGRATQVAPLLEPLVAAGFSVLAYDVLSHGEAPRALVSVVDFAEVALSVVRSRQERIHAAIGHSVGGTALTVAAAAEPFTDRLALIASPRHPRGFLAQFGEALRLSGATRAALLARLERRYDLPFAQLDATESAAESAVRALVVHDRHDREVPLAHGERLAAAFKAGELLITEELGHRRILRDPQVVRAVVDFVSAAPRERSLLEALSDELFDRDARLLRAS